MSKFKIDESLARRLLNSEWVRSTRSEVDTGYHLNEGYENYHSKTEVRVVVHTKGLIRDKDDFNNICLDILGDPIFEGKDVKFTRTFYDTCIYLTHYDGDGNHIDIILSIPDTLRKDNRAKMRELYSELSGCEMKRSSTRMDCETWSCGVK